MRQHDQQFFDSFMLVIGILMGVAVVLFFLVHIVMVLVSGVWNNLRSMITGRYLIRPAGGADDQA